MCGTGSMLKIMLTPCCWGWDSREGRRGERSEEIVLVFSSLFVGVPVCCRRRRSCVLAAVGGLPLLPLLVPLLPPLLAVPLLPPPLRRHLGLGVAEPRLARLELPVARAAVRAVAHGAVKVTHAQRRGRGARAAQDSRRPGPPRPVPSARRPWRLGPQPSPRPSAHAGRTQPLVLRADGTVLE